MALRFSLLLPHIWYPLSYRTNPNLHVPYDLGEEPKRQKVREESKGTISEIDQSNSFIDELCRHEFSSQLFSVQLFFLFSFHSVPFFPFLLSISLNFLRPSF